MSAIIPIPTTRVSDVLVRQRLLTQLGFDQLDLLRLQTQLSTGRRIALPSEDPQASQRAISLQRLLERKAQIQENLTTAQSFLTATDTALASVTGTIAEIKGAVLSATGNTASPQEREAVALQIEAAIDQLINVGNRTYRGRYLFAGSRSTTQPFSRDGQQITYIGNERRLSSLLDVDQLFDTSVDGNAVFGSISQTVLGGVDFNPIVTSQSRLEDLNRGAGVARGSVLVSDGTSSATIDLSAAATLGDVARLLEAGFQAAHPPTSNRLSVRVTTTGLTVSLDSGQLTISDVAAGQAAADLGILQETPAGNTRVGDDLDPRLTLTTSLNDVLGVRASAIVPSVGTRNDLVITAASRGAGLNNVQIIFASGGTAGAETAVFDSGAGTLTVTIASGVSTANQVVAAINAQVSEFQAALDTVEANNDGTGVITATAPAAAATTAGGSGADFDPTGIQIDNREQRYEISFATAQTVQDLLNLINGSPAGMVAQINSQSNGIDVRSHVSGTSFAIGERGGGSATQLGIRSLAEGTRLEELNLGRGVVRSDEGPDLQIELDDGTSYGIEISTATTIAEVIAAINTQTLGNVTARLAASGNGLELVAADTSPTAALTVRKTPGSQAAVDLGLVPPGADSATAAVAGATEVLAGRDVNPQEVRGVFTALARLRDAVRAGDQRELERAGEMLDEAFDRVNFVRAQMGAQQQQLDALTDRLGLENIELQSALSDELDVDLAQVISELTARQAAYEAALRTTAQLFRLTLIDFI